MPQWCEPVQVMREEDRDFVVPFLDIAPKSQTERTQVSVGEAGAPPLPGRHSEDV